MTITPLNATDVANAAIINAQLANIDAGIVAATPPPTGFMVAYAGGSAPIGWLLCDGSAVSRATYAALFALIATTYGVGNGSTTFNLPDLRGRTAIGSGTGSGLTARTLAQTMGEENHQLSTAELPAHTHTLQKTGTTANSTAGVASELWQAGAFSGTTGFQGSDTPHNNMQPSVALNFIIKA